MMLRNTLTAVGDLSMRTLRIFILLLILSGINSGTLHATLTPTHPLAATSTVYGVAATPVASPIPALTIFSNTKQTFTVNGSFDAGGNPLTFSASLNGGGSLPSWMSIDAATGVFTFSAPSSVIGELYEIKVTAKDGNAGASATFYLLVDNSSFNCSVDANTDGLARMLDCKSGKATLRGYSSTDSYRWTGPNGFTSSAEEPVVSAPGLYTLTTSDKSSCGRKSIVEVLPTSAGCSGNTSSNKIPVGTLKASRTTGNTPLRVSFDATSSSDPDGSIVDYFLSWDGGYASGAKPVVTFPEGTHEVMLTVTDNTGAKSTDRLSISSKKVVDLHAYWLEAECATVGSNWSVGLTGAASGGNYVVADRNAFSAPTKEQPENRIRFTIDNVVQADYSLFARIEAADNTSDSYWVRVNGGSWYEWYTGITNGGGFNWNEAPLDLALRSGTNTIDFAFREAGARLDKLVVTTGADLPTGMGENATNCVSNKSPIARVSATPTSGTGPLNVSLDASASSDPDGSIQNYGWAWNGGSGSGMRPNLTFAEGNYSITLTVTDNDGATDSAVVAIEVKAPAPSSGSGQNSFWLEAECAAVGDKWSTVTSSAASSGKYVVVRSGDSYGAAPADVSKNLVRFEVSSAKAGNYNLFARIDAANGLDDSYWVRVNEGNWIRWAEGMQQGRGFQWNKMRNSLSLEAGSNTIDFAYREDGTKLDKIFLTTTRTKPSGMGEDATNCGATAGTGPAVDIWMEAECASLGSDWYSYSSTSASGDNYVAFTGPNNTSSPSTDASQQIKFSVSITESGTYHLYLRLDAADSGHNSFWVRVDNGKWVNFRKNGDGSELNTQGLQWREVKHDGQDVTFNLSTGTHTITVANREAGTRLDKLHLTRSATLPDGLGGQATNCSSTSQPITTFSNSTQSQSQTTEEAAMEEEFVAEAELSIFPNPAVNDLTVQLTSSYEGRVDVYLIDVSGRSIREFHFDKVGDQLQTGVNVSDLPNGMYRIRVIEGNQQLVKPFVKM